MSRRAKTGELKVSKNDANNTNSHFPKVKKYGIFMINFPTETLVNPVYWSLGSREVNENLEKG